MAQSNPTAAELRDIAARLPPELVTEVITALERERSITLPPPKPPPGSVPGTPPTTPGSVPRTPPTTPGSVPRTPPTTHDCVIYRCGGKKVHRHERK
jgi:hypothetical protein